jgi:SAM-dependent methyltransferase
MLGQSSNYLKHTSNHPLQRALIARFHHRLVERVAALEPATVLDAGCGEGFVARVLERRLPEVAVTGCDVSRSAVRLAAARQPAARFVVASLLALPFPDAAFDVVACIEVLEHLPAEQPQLALRELARVARRGVVVSVPHEPLFCLANAARGKNLGLRPPGSDPDHRQWWSPGAFVELLSRDLDVAWVGGAFPWTLCIARPRYAAGG